MPRRRLPWWCAIVFVVHLLSCTAPSAFAADKVGLRTRAYTRVSVKRTCLGGAQRDQAPEWASKLPEARKFILLLETLATAVPALQMDGPLSQSVEALAEGHAVLRDSQEEWKAALLVLLASSGKGKSRFLYELNQLLQKQSRAMCIPITFNGQQNLDLDLDIEAVENLTAQPRQRALVHVVLRLLHATFEIDDLRRFAIDFCNKLKTAATELSTDLLEDVLAECAKTRDSVENLTILVDESGRLPKLLNMQKGDGDEFSVLRSLCAPASVITLLEQEIEDALKKWVLYEADSKASVQCWLNSFVGLCCGKSLKTKANNTELYNKLVLRPLVVEYVPLARALQYLTEAVNQTKVATTKLIRTAPQLGSTIRRVGLDLRNSVDKKLNVRYDIVAERLTPAVLAPAILPSHRLLVSLKQEIGGHRVSKLLSEGAYANALEQLRDDAEFLPKIVPAFLRQAAQIQPDLRYLQDCWRELEEVLKAQAGGTADAGNLLDVGAAAYQMQVPDAVTLMQEPLNASTNILQFAIKKARNGKATVLALADGQAGADSVAVLPLDDSEVLVLGLEPHGGDSKGGPDKRHAGHPQDKRSVFWQGLPSKIQEEKDVRFALLYITHDEIVNKADVLEQKWNSTVRRDSKNPSDVVNLLLMDRAGGSGSSDCPVLLIYQAGPAAEAHVQLCSRPSF
eukprot:s1926_g1.t2